MHCNHILPSDGPDILITHNNGYNQTALQSVTNNIKKDPAEIIVYGTMILNYIERGQDGFLTKYICLSFFSMNDDVRRVK